MFTGDGSRRFNAGLTGRSPSRAVDGAAAPRGFRATLGMTAWVRAADDTTARVDPNGVTSDHPDHPWITTLTATLEATR